MKSSSLLFLRDLAQNNNREWFMENKPRYTEAQEDMINLVQALIDETAAFDEDLARLDARKSIFRIYRDVRFSQDKSPYKTNFGANLGMGKNDRVAGYYIHVEPGKSFLAGGVYRPEPAVLKEIRKELSNNGKEFLDILNAEEFRHNFRGLSVEGKLQRVPTGFEKDDPMAEYLKLKGFNVSYPVSDEALLEPDAAAKFAKIFKSIKPMNDYLQAPFR